MKFAISLSFDGRPNETPPVIKNCPWNTRAWTFQESVLSQRLFFITEDQVLFQYGHGTFREDEVGVHDLASMIKPRDPLDKWWEPEEVYLQLSRLGLADGRDLGYKSSLNADLYCSMVADYTARQLTYDSDIFNAFRGLTNKLQPCFRSNFSFGLPESELEMALLWQPRVPRQPHNSMTRRSGFPSWSWLSWKGTVLYPANALGKRPLISTQGTNLLWRDASKADVDINGAWFTPDDFRAPTSDAQNFSAQCIQEKYGSTHGYYEHKPSITFLNPIVPETHRSPRLHLKPGTQLLELRAISAFFCLKKLIPHKPISINSPHEMYILDSDGYYAGHCRPRNRRLIMSPV
jgi:hypothetical protein